MLGLTILAIDFVIPLHDFRRGICHESSVERRYSFDYHLQIIEDLLVVFFNRACETALIFLGDSSA